MSRIVDRIPLFISRVRVMDILLKLWHETEDQEDKIDFDSIVEFVHSPAFAVYLTYGIVITMKMEASGSGPFTDS